MDINEFCGLFKQLIGVQVETCLEITDGCSGALKYKVSFNGQAWMAKVIKISPDRIQWYQGLAEIREPGLAIPDIYTMPDTSKVLILAPWVSGVRLDSVLGFSDPSVSAKYGRLAALLLKRLHHKSVMDSGYPDRLKARVDRLCSVVMQYELSFPARDVCMDFVKTYVKYIHPMRIAYLHRDIRPENFIVCENTISLIDFDNGSVGESEADFVYLTTMGESKHRAFAKSLILNYLDGCVTNEFWEKNLFYSTLQVMEYAVWKWEVKQKQMLLQAQNLLLQYDCFQSIEPLWWWEG